MTGNHPSSSQQLESELRGARREIDRQRHQLASLLVLEESERRELSSQIHDEAAQGLAAIQLGLRALEPELEAGPAAAVEQLRAQLAETVRVLRELAVELRPPALDHLGLEPALRTLVDRANHRREEPIELLLQGLAGRLPPAIETCLYRIVADIAGALPGAIRLRVAVRGESLRIRVSPAGGSPVLECGRELRARLSARAELVGGAITLPEGPGPLLAELPVSDQAAARPSTADLLVGT